MLLLFNTIFISFERIPPECKGLDGAYIIAVIFIQSIKLSLIGI